MLQSVLMSELQEISLKMFSILCLTELIYAISWVSSLLTFCRHCILFLYLCSNSYRSFSMLSLIVALMSQQCFLSPSFLSLYIFLIPSSARSWSDSFSSRLSIAPCISLDSFSKLSSQNCGFQCRLCVYFAVSSHTLSLCSFSCLYCEILILLSVWQLFSLSLFCWNYLQNFWSLSSMRTTYTPFFITDNEQVEQQRLPSLTDLWVAYIVVLILYSCNGNIFKGQSSTFQPLIHRRHL